MSRLPFFLAVLTLTSAPAVAMSDPFAEGPDAPIAQVSVPEPTVVALPSVGAPVAPAVSAEALVPNVADLLPTLALPLDLSLARPLVDVTPTRVAVASTGPHASQLAAWAPALPAPVGAAPQASEASGASESFTPGMLAASNTPAPSVTREEKARVETASVTPPRDAAVSLAAGGIAAGFAGVIAAAMYSRISPSATLGNNTRKRIFDAVCERPGLGVDAIAKSAEVSYSTATYHLERLVAANMLVMTPSGNKLCYYKNGGAFSEIERKLIPILENREATRVLEAIIESPGTYRAALAERLGVTATTINWHLKRLREAHLVEETRQGRSAYLFPRIVSLREHLDSLARKLNPENAGPVERLIAHTEASGA